MLKIIEITDEAIITAGEIAVGDNYPGFCCEGFDWEVALVFPDSDPHDVATWGICQNPKCPCDDGVQNLYYDDFVEALAEMPEVAK